MALGRSGNCSILQVSGLENIETTLTSLFINISADTLCLQLSALADRRGRVEAMVFWRHKEAGNPELKKLANYRRKAQYYGKWRWNSEK